MALQCWCIVSRVWARDIPGKRKRQTAQAVVLCVKLSQATAGGYLIGQGLEPGRGKGGCEISHRRAARSETMRA